MKNAVLTLKRYEHRTLRSRLYGTGLLTAWLMAITFGLTSLFLSVLAEHLHEWTALLLSRTLV